MERLGLTRVSTSYWSQAEMSEGTRLRPIPAPVSFTSYKQDTPLWTQWMQLCDSYFMIKATEAGQLQESVERHRAKHL